MKLTSVSRFCFLAALVPSTNYASVEHCDVATLKVIVNPLYNEYKTAVNPLIGQPNAKSRRALLIASKILAALQSCKLSGEYEAVRESITRYSGDLKAIDVALLGPSFPTPTVLVRSPTSGTVGGSVLHTNPLTQLKSNASVSAVGAVVVSSDDLNLLAQDVSRAASAEARARLFEGFRQKTQSVTLEKVVGTGK